eukprot:7799045-Prorocentrum_lima.AAC.1
MSGQMYCVQHGTMLKREGTDRSHVATRAKWTGQKQRRFQWHWEDEQVLGKFIAMARAVNAEKVGAAEAWKHTGPWGVWNGSKAVKFTAWTMFIATIVTFIRTVSIGIVMAPFLFGAHMHGSASTEVKNKHCHLAAFSLIAALLGFEMGCAKAG